MRIYIGGFLPDVPQTELRQLFTRLPDIQLEEYYFPINKLNGQSRGFGFVTLKSKSSSRNDVANDGLTAESRARVDAFIKAYHNAKWKGGRLKVEIASPNYLEKLAKEKTKDSLQEGLPRSEILEPSKPAESPEQGSAHAPRRKTVRLGIGNGNNKKYIIVPLDPIESKADLQKKMKEKRAAEAISPAHQAKRQRRFDWSVNSQFSAATIDWDSASTDSSRQNTTLKFPFEEEEKLTNDKMAVEKTAKANCSNDDESEGTEDVENEPSEIATDSEDGDEEIGEVLSDVDVENISFVWGQGEAKAAEEEDAAISVDVHSQNEDKKTTEEAKDSVDADESDNLGGLPKNADDEFAAQFQEETKKSLDILSAMFPDMYGPQTEQATKDIGEQHTAGVDIEESGLGLLKRLGSGKESTNEIRKRLFGLPGNSRSLSSLNVTFTKYDPTSKASASLFEISNTKDAAEDANMLSEETVDDQKTSEEKTKHANHAQSVLREWETSTSLKSIFGRHLTTVEEEKVAQAPENFSFSSLFGASDHLELDKSGVEGGLDDYLQKAEDLLDEDSEPQKDLAAHQKTANTNEEKPDLLVENMETEAVAVNAIDVKRMVDKFCVPEEDKEQLETHWLEYRRTLTIDFRRKHKQVLKLKRRSVVALSNDKRERR